VTFDAKYLNTNAGAKLDYRAFDISVGPGGAVGLAFVSSATGARPGVRYLALYHSRLGADGLPAAAPRIIEPIRETNIFVRVATETDSSSNFAVAWVVGAKVRLRVYTTASGTDEESEE